MVQLSHLHMNAGKTIALIIWTFVGKVMSLLFNTLSSFVINFLLRSKRLLVSWLQSPSAVILEPKSIKSVTASTFSPSICHEAMGLSKWHPFSHFNCLTMSNSWRAHGLQHARLPCPSPTPGAHLNSCPLSWWCHPTISYNPDAHQFLSKRNVVYPYIRISMRIFCPACCWPWSITLGHCFRPADF